MSKFSKLNNITVESKQTTHLSWPSFYTRKIGMNIDIDRKSGRKHQTKIVNVDNFSNTYNFDLKARAYVISNGNQ